MKLQETAFKLDNHISLICSNPKIKSDNRKKRLIVEVWNTLLGQQERYAQDEKHKAIYLSYMGMVTNTIANKLTATELEEFTKVITADMRQSNFNNWKWRKKDKKGEQL